MYVEQLIVEKREGKEELRKATRGGDWAVLERGAARREDSETEIGQQPAERRVDQAPFSRADMLTNLRLDPIRFTTCRSITNLVCLHNEFC